MDDTKHKRDNFTGDPGPHESDQGDAACGSDITVSVQIPGPEATGTTDGEFGDSNEEGEG